MQCLDIYVQYKSLYCVQCYIVAIFLCPIYTRYKLCKNIFLQPCSMCLYLPDCVHVSLHVFERRWEDTLVMEQQFIVASSNIIQVAELTKDATLKHHMPFVKHLVKRKNIKSSPNLQDWKLISVPVMVMVLLVFFLFVCFQLTCMSYYDHLVSFINNFFE